MRFNTSQYMCQSLYHHFKEYFKSKATLLVPKKQRGASRWNAFYVLLSRGDESVRHIIQQLPRLTPAALRESPIVRNAYNEYRNNPDDLARLDRIVIELNAKHNIDTAQYETDDRKRMAAATRSINKISDEVCI
jgi:hypothetical protein